MRTTRAGLDRRISRRALLRSAAAATATLASSPGLAALARAQAASSGGGDPGDTRELPQPEALRSRDGLLATTLRAAPAVVDMWAARPVTTWAYDGVVPGRTWDIRAGDTLRFDLVNDLPALPEHEGEPDLTRPHEWTTTNIHTHGLHVSPLGNGDNIFLEVPPGERFRYRIPVPAEHPGGMFWYHPHKHGGVAHQVRAGLAGAIIVRGAIDEVEVIRAAREQVMVLQAIELGEDFQLLDPIPYPTTEQAFFPRTQILYTVNGVLEPTVTMYPGEVQRWRLLNAAEGKFMSLRLGGHPLHVLAWDGLPLAAPESAEVLMLSAANRAEVLVKAGARGVYQLVLTPGSSQRPDIPGMPDEPSATAGPGPDATPAHPRAPVPSSELQPRPILTLVVRGDGPEMGLPSGLPAYGPPIHPIARRRQLAYTVERRPEGEFIDFGVDGVPFDPARPAYQIRLGTAEEWTLVNGVDPRLDRHAHVFHIHVNPFKVTRINGAPLATPLWRDTFVLTGASGDSITFESNFDDFTGRFVDHCHVLSHEDLGMMEALEVVP